MSFCWESVRKLIESNAFAGRNVREAMNDLVPLPPSIGVMILPGTVLLPGSLLPLYIFEPRYRKMLQEALETHRMFAVASHASGEEEVGSIGGVGIVRACVANEDGTSNLVLQGMGRVRFEEWVQTSVFPRSEIQPVIPHASSSSVGAALRKEILSLVTKLPSKDLGVPAQLKDLLSQVEDSETFSDTASAYLVGEASIRQRLLEEPDPVHRLEILAAFLTFLLAPK